MQITITDEQRRELRRALFERAAQLEKLKKRNEAAGLHQGAADADYHLRIITGGPGPEKGLLDLLADPWEQEQAELPFEQAPSQPIEEVLEGIEEEAAGRIREREIREALASVLPDLDRGVPLSDADLEREIAIAFEALEDEDETDEAGPDPLPMGYVRHTAGDGREVLCYASGGTEPAFWYDVPANEFDPLDQERWPPTLAGQALLDAARSVLGIERPAEGEENPGDTGTQDEDDPVVRCAELLAQARSVGVQVDELTVDELRTWPSRYVEQASAWAEGVLERNRRLADPSIKSMDLAIPPRPPTLSPDFRSLTRCPPSDENWQRAADEAAPEVLRAALEWTIAPQQEGGRHASRLKRLVSVMQRRGYSALVQSVLGTEVAHA